MRRYDIKSYNHFVWQFYFYMESSDQVDVAHYVELIRSVIHDASHIWLRRTAYISLILLNDKYYEKQYLELIKNDSAECLCNIGDLLRYYGDMERLMQLMWIRKS